jgi:hypothetical protein
MPVEVHLDQMAQRPRSVGLGLVRYRLFPGIGAMPAHAAARTVVTRTAGGEYAASPTALD